MEHYLIAIDMDGTLLRNNQTISQKTIEKIKRFTDCGHLVVIASGRPFRAIKKFYDQLGLKTPVICYNGAYIHSEIADFPKFESSFPREIIKQIIHTIGHDKIVNIMCETNHEIWLLKHDDILKDFFIHDGMNIIYGDVEQTLDKNPMTMIIQTNDRKHNEVILNAIESHKNLKCRFWSGKWDCFSEIYFDYTNKANALQKISEYYKISNNNIITIGDASNDLEMIEFAGCGIAMINGDQELKDKADVVSEYTNEEDGAVLAIEKILKEHCVI